MSNHNPKPHGKDLRKGRYSEPNQAYLVTTVTMQREPVFLDFALGRLVVQAMRRQQEQGNVQSLAFVVMPDHLHWLFVLQNASLSEIMQNIKGSSSYEIQKIRRARGEIRGNPLLWQEGYHDHAARKEEDLRQIARYIVANPLRAGLVEKIGDYPLWDGIWL